VAFKAVGLRGRTPGAEQGVSSRELGALAFAALALALFATVGLASSVSPWHANRAAASAPTTALQSLAAAGGVVLVVALLLLWVETPTARRPKRKKRTLAGDEFDELGTSLWTAAKAVAVLLLALAIFCLATLPLLSRASAPLQSGAGAHPSTPARPARNVPGRPADSVNLGWLLVPVAVTFAILTPAAVVIRRRRLNRDEAMHAGETSAFGRAVRASIAALESERDPRTAILRAYARMEQAFRHVEIVRAGDETASEFLARTTRRLPVSAGAAAALTERFEEVRFSTHVITEADREQALVSLHRVEQQLEERS
jgi:uncharacterized protein YjeT (DUF2065 family)